MSKSSSCPKHSSTIVIQMQGTPRQGSMLKGLINKLNIKSFWILIFDIVDVQITNLLHLSFLFFWLVEEGEVWFEGDSTWLINYKKRIRYCQFFPQAQLSIIFTTINLIYTLVYISIFEQFFFSVAWNMNLSQTVSNNIIGNMLFWGNLYWKRYKIWACCKTWSGVWGLFWSGVWSHFWSRFWSHFWSRFWSHFWSRF